MKALVCAVLILVAEFSLAQGKTLLISDIDDTLKISHVLDKTESVKNAFRIENLFSGMNSLYRAVLAQDPALKFYYITHAPRAIMEGSHRDFLSLHEFPSGELRLRSDIFDGTFKLRQIRDILKHENPGTVILVGDNAESDPTIYAQIQREHSHIRFLTYIHTSYYTQDREDRGKPLEAGQIGYVSAWDLLLHWRHEGLIADITAVQFLQAFAPAFLQEPPHLKTGSLVIPAWMDCRDFLWTAPDEAFVNFNEHHFVKEKILRRCSREEIED